MGIIDDMDRECIRLLHEAAGPKQDWVVTIPKNVSWTTWAAELNHARKGGELMHYRLPFKVGVRPGDRCFIVYQGHVRGWLPIEGVGYLKGFTCSLTGKVWPEGWYVIRRPEWHAIKGGHPMKGFRGIRRLEGFTDEHDSR